MLGLTKYDTDTDLYPLPAQRQGRLSVPRNSHYIKNISQDIITEEGTDNRSITIVSRPSGQKQPSHKYYDRRSSIRTVDTLTNDGASSSSETLEIRSCPVKDRIVYNSLSEGASDTGYEIQPKTKWRRSYGSEGYAPVPRATHFSQTSNDTFERPVWGPIGLVTTLCIFTYPFLRFVAFIATNQSLFWARTIVSLGCGVVGFTFSIIFNAFASRHLAACTWATVIHKSRVGGAFNDEGPGIRVRDLARVTEFPTSIWSGIRLLFLRMSIRGAGRAARGGYDGRPWSLFIIFFLFLVGLNTSISFIYGRIVIIDTVTVQQSDIFDEVVVWGELSSEDLASATNLDDAFNTLPINSGWWLTPFASLGDLPPVVSFFDETSNSLVYFADSYASQLRTDGSALGTFKLDSISTLKNASSPSLISLSDASLSRDSTEGFLQFPKWGIRIQCAKIPDPVTNILLHTNSKNEYVFITESVVQELFVSLSLSYPGTDVLAMNVSTIFEGNDTLPESINASSIIYGYSFSDDGQSLHYLTSPLDSRNLGHGWITIDLLYVRLNTTYTPNGTYPVYGDPVSDSRGKETRIGYDAAVCVEAYEPWVVETYNASGIPPSSTRLLGQIPANISTSMNSTDGWNVWKKETRAKSRLHAGEGGAPAEIHWTLNSTGKFNTFILVFSNSGDQLIKDIGLGTNLEYSPPPILVSFTNGIGPKGYTELSTDLVAMGRALADATYVLPLLAGSGSLAARFYPITQLARVHIKNLWFLVATGTLFLVSLLAGLCVPRLPLSVPRRGFDLISWLAVLHGDEMIVQLPALSGDRDNIGLHGKMTIEEINEKLGDVKVKYKI